MTHEKGASDMTVCLTLLSATAWNPTRSRVFGDESLGERDLREARAVVATLPPHSLIVRTPSPGCARIAETVGLDSTPEPALRDLDYGTWRGRTVDEIATADPHGFSAWLTDPAAAPHGGETVRGLCHRSAHWLAGVPRDGARTLAIVEPALARALLVHALSAPVKAFWRLEVAALSPISLTTGSDGWHVRFTSVIPPDGPSSRPETLSSAARRAGSVFGPDGSPQRQPAHVTPWPHQPLGTGSARPRGAPGTVMTG
ncbi:histidine phosphatase family protein [Streptomyces sp. NPDC046197]|uniref:histidine phosphatase family protein n=1 Tax=Streptomyces sp. NPDC046197 TaxID=3154337 RepID=UPI0033F80F36